MNLPVATVAAIACSHLLLLGCDYSMAPAPDVAQRTASGILVHHPPDVRTAEAWRGHHFVVDGVPVQPSEKVPETELLKYVGKRISVNGRWNPGRAWQPAQQDRHSQVPVGSGNNRALVRGDGIVVEAVRELKDR